MLVPDVSTTVGSILSVPDVDDAGESVVMCRMLI
jgi:hypothetical protein